MFPKTSLSVPGRPLPVAWPHPAHGAPRAPPEIWRFQTPFLTTHAHDKSRPEVPTLCKDVGALAHSPAQLSRGARAPAVGGLARAQRPQRGRGSPGPRAAVGAGVEFHNLAHSREKGGPRSGKDVGLAQVAGANLRPFMLPKAAPPVPGRPLPVAWPCGPHSSRGREGRRKAAKWRSTWRGRRAESATRAEPRRTIHFWKARWQSSMMMCHSTR